MELKGDTSIETTPEVLYRLLTEPQVLVRTMPGLKTLEPEGEDRYRAEMEIGVAAVRGHYTGHMEIRDRSPGRSYRLTMYGQGPGGFVDVDLAVRFEPGDTGTQLRYAGEANVGGTVAGVGQRMLSSVAKFILNQFFGNVAKEARQVGGAG